MGGKTTVGIIVLLLWGLGNALACRNIYLTGVTAGFWVWKEKAKFQQQINL